MAQDVGGISHKVQMVECAMSRSGYSDDIDNWQMIKWRGMVASATRGKRGQKFFRDLLEALDVMPVKELIDSELEKDGDVCAIGSLGKHRCIDMDKIDPECPDQVARGAIKMEVKGYKQEHDISNMPHRLSCPGCRRLRICNRCAGHAPNAYRCTNGRCAECCTKVCKHARPQFSSRNAEAGY